VMRLVALATFNAAPTKRGTAGGQIDLMIVDVAGIDPNVVVGTMRRVCEFRTSAGIVLHAQFVVLKTVVDGAARAIVGGMRQLQGHPEVGALIKMGFRL
jgi:hypothetical protein